ncbi:MAG: TraB/GumN family protein [Candidatus Woesearchaeota archaeon]|nr:MAG: TraB/GumN family protein [Candidatus Woesearchaeota archaeon]
MAHIHLVGTNHVAAASSEKLKKAVETYHPSILAIELDKHRFDALLKGMQPSKPSFALLRLVGIRGFFFAMIASYAQRRIGAIVNVTPGSEFLTAAALAKEKNISLALIDRNIFITLRRLHTSFKFRHLFRFLIRGMRGKIKQPRFALDSVPSPQIVAELLEVFKKELPGLYLPLVDERNKVMARNLQAIAREHPNATIVAVMGAAHVKGVQELLS